MKNNILLFNPVGVVHDRNMRIFEDNMPGWSVRRICNPKNPLFAEMEKMGRDEMVFFRGGRAGAECFRDVGAVVLFTAQPRVYPCSLIQEAAFRNIPVVAIEEVYQMMFEQGVVNEYLLPVDRLFVGSEYERTAFIKIGVPPEVAETTGCVFRNKRPRTRKMSDIKNALGIAGGKRVATLCLAYLTPSGETLEIRRRLLSLVSDGLPADYELVVKPHPAEKTKDMVRLISAMAPAAKIAGSDMPIDDILDFTDVLINRGNSQVVIDALQRNVPVIIAPVGRRTLFHGLLNEVVASRPDDIVKILELVRKGGIKIYDPVFKNYALLSPEEALGRTMERLRHIAGNCVLYRPDQRLAEIAMFWAAMGYSTQALDVLKRIRVGPDVKKVIIEKIYRLVLCRASGEDMVFLKKWVGEGYRDWLLKSLWIKCLYLTGVGLTGENMEWLEKFPPRMNREFFIPFTCMLAWCHVKAGRYDEASAILNEIEDEFGHLGEVINLKNAVNFDNKFNARIRYLCAMKRDMFKMAAKDVAYRFGVAR